MNDKLRLGLLAASATAVLALSACKTGDTADNPPPPPPAPAGSSMVPAPPPDNSMVPPPPPPPPTDSMPSPMTTDTPAATP